MAGHSCHDRRCALLADGMITPPISVTSAIEGLRQILPASAYHRDSKRSLSLFSAYFRSFLFFAAIWHRFYRKNVWPDHVYMVYHAGRSGCLFIYLMILIFSKHSARIMLFNFLQYLSGKDFGYLGAVFLCTTGAEALYSDLGHCGQGNIRYLLDFCKNLSAH